MIIYSNQIIQFVHEIKRIIQEILSKEVGLRVSRERFYDLPQKASYPINVVIYNNKPMLGYFDSNFYELGFHECLMHSPKHQLHQIIRHEVAHYMSFIEHGEHIQSHGPEFRNFCKKMGWGEEVYRATTCLEDGADVREIEESAVFRKVQKLMALATSSNQNEAEQAMIKSQQLLLKHHMESKIIDDEEKVFLKRILKQKKENAKLRSIAKILETFFVSTVFRRAEDATYLEILGSKVNVEIAEYVADVLQRELDSLWGETMKQTRLKGTIAKNSFFLGLAKGYCNKIQALKRDIHEKNALIVIEKKLTDARAMAYQRLSRIKSNGSHCRYSSALGEQVGQQLNINPALNKGSKSEALIGFKK